MNGLEKGSLPDGWRWAQLGEVAKVFAGSAAPQGEDYFDPQGPRFVRVSDLGQKGRTSFLVNIRDRLSPKALRQCSLVLAKKGTVLFPKSGAAITTNNRALLGIDAYIVSHLMAVEPTEQTTSDWLYWSLCQLDMMDYSDNVGYPSLKQSTVEKVTIPLPPLSEQKHIAAILNEQMAAVEGAQAAAEAQLEAAKTLPAAYLRAVFNSPEGRQWPRRPLGELVENFDGKRVPVKLDERRGKRGPYPYYGASGIIDYVDEYLFEGEYLLVSEDGANLLLRSSPIAFKASGKFWVNNHAHVVQPRDTVSLEYLLYFLAVTDLKPYVTGAAQPKLTQEDMNSIPIPVAPMLEQQLIMARLSEQMTCAERTRKALEEQFDAINKLPAALLHRAFKGEL